MINMLHCKQQGPRGGKGGTEFSIAGQGPVTAIHIRCGGWIDAIHFSYKKNDGTENDSEKAGGNGGSLKTFHLSEGEKISRIHGGAGNFVEVIRIETNKGRSEIFGNAHAEQSFTYTIPEGHQLIGFTGRSGTYIDAIGIITMPEQEPGADQEEDPFSHLSGLA